MTSPDRFMSGALDLGQLKAAADAREQASSGTVAAYVDVTLSNFEAEVVQRSTQVPVVVLVGSERSQDSVQLQQDLKSLAQASNLSFIVAYVDADNYGQIASALNVKVVPTVVALAAGRPLTQFEGPQPMEALQQWTEALVTQVGAQLPGLPDDDSTQAPAEDPRFEPATAALNAGDYDGAIAVYDAILAEEPNNGEAKQARMTTLLMKRLAARDALDAGDPIAAADADPNNLNKAFDAADAEIIAGNAKAGFDRLTALMRVTFGDEKNAVRDRLVELFSMFEPSDPTVLEARRNMASAMY